ncbi:MAG: nucleotidyltransferase domain-containing protein [Chloroflexi bacterium]|nr:nucleotidyltransferase domain-containing protein [Chloroflexota bacterium]
MALLPFSPPSKKQLQPIAQKYGLRFIVLFGSVARGRVHEESDIDIGVLAERPLTLNRRLKLWLELSNLFRAEIDLAVLNHAEPVFGFEVARDGELLYERDNFAWENWRSYKIRQFWDTGKFRDDLERYVARRVKGMGHAPAT